MRVIAGKARRLVLKTVEGMDTRPTTDRIKETLFNMIQDDVPGCIFLDLFSGSGQIGIEALSRGAKKAVFVEKGREQISCIRENLKKTRLETEAVVLPLDVLTAIDRLKRTCDQPFDFIFMDPPYKLDIERPVLEALAGSPLVGDHTIIIIEADRHTEFDWIEETGFKVLKEKEYKTNKHLFLEKGV